MFSDISGNGLTLRLLAAGDAGRFHDVLSRPECTRFSDLCDAPDRAWSDRFVARMLTLAADGKGCAWAIETPKAPFAGCIRLNVFNARTRQATVGFELDPEHWGQGIATGALAALCAHTHGPLHAHRIEAWTMPGNAASERVLEKCGFRHEGTLRGKGFFKGAHHDMRIFARLAGDPI